MAKSRFSAFSVMERAHVNNFHIYSGNWPLKRFFPTKIGNKEPAQLTDAQLQRLDCAFNTMQISSACVKTG